MQSPLNGDLTVVELARIRLGDAPYRWVPFMGGIGVDCRGSPILT